MQTNALTIRADALTIQTDALIMQADVLTIQTDALIMQADALTMQTNALIMQANVLTMQTNALIMQADLTAYPLKKSCYLCSPINLLALNPMAEGKNIFSSFCLLPPAVCLSSVISQFHANFILK